MAKAARKKEKSADEETEEDGDGSGHDDDGIKNGRTWAPYRHEWDVSMPGLCAFLFLAANVTKTISW